jgi:hypothetical protein
MTTRCEFVATIDARLQLARDQKATVLYTLRGLVDRLHIPRPVTPRWVEGLWRSTCFEVFFAGEGTPEYHEFNFSPSGEWAAYTFRDYRNGGAVKELGLDPAIIVHGSNEQLELEAVVRLDRLPQTTRTGALRIGLAAVIETQDGGLSYWALKHPPGKPDFHHPDGFLLEIKV